MTTIKLHYSRQLGQHQLTTSVEFDLAEGTDLKEGWEAAYQSLTRQVDARFDSDVAPQDSAAVTTDEVSQPERTITAPEEGGSVDFTSCRVMFKPKESDSAAKKPYVRLRIGNGEQIPGQYIDVKSFDPEVMSELRRLRQGDMVDVKGVWDKPWTKRNSEGIDDTQWDVIVESIERV